MADNLLDDFSRDFARLQTQKASAVGGIEARVLQNLAFLMGEHWIESLPNALQVVERDPNKLYLVFNVIKARFMKLLGRITAATASYKAVPDRQDPKAFAESEVVDQLLKALDEKLDEPTRDWERKWWMGIGGVVFEHVCWVPNATIEPMPKTGPDGQPLFTFSGTGVEMTLEQAQQLIASGAPPEQFEIAQEAVPTGEVGSEILGPLNVFIDASVRSIEDLAPDQAVYIAKFRTLGWVAQNFPDTPQAIMEKLEGVRDFAILKTRFNQIGPASAGTALVDLIPMVQGTRSEDDPPIALVVERFQPASEAAPEGRYTVFVPDIDILRDGAIPYDTHEIPLVDFHWEPVTTSFWTHGYVERLIPPQKFINKRMSQLGEEANAEIYGKTLLGAGLKREDLTADMPTVVENAVNDAGVPLVQRVPGPQLPNWFLESINLSVKLFNDLAGGLDLFEEQKFPGQLRGPLAVPLLQEIIDTEWGPLFNHYAQRLGRVKQMRVNLVKQFYPPTRTLHYTNRNQRDEVFTFHTKQILRSGTNYDITIERGSMLPELRALREARIRERLASPLAILYYNERTGRLDRSKIAADLQFGDEGREGKEATYRKLAGEILDRLWRGEPVPTPLPFWNHSVLMDELEIAMATTEFLSTSPQVQQAFFQFWNTCREFLTAAADRQQAAMQQQMVQGAVAQATQQAAATAASRTVEATFDQVAANKQVAAEQRPDAALIRAASQVADRRR